MHPVRELSDLHGTVRDRIVLSMEGFAGNHRPTPIRIHEREKDPRSLPSYRPKRGRRRGARDRFVRIA